MPRIKRADVVPGIKLSLCKSGNVANLGIIDKVLLFPSGGGYSFKNAKQAFQGTVFEVLQKPQYHEGVRTVKVKVLDENNCEILTAYAYWAEIWATCEIL